VVAPAGSRRLAREGWPWGGARPQRLGALVGGVGPYLTFFSRARLSRETVDQAVADVEIHELPAARGCTYVVPKSDYALALTVGQITAGAELKVAINSASPRKRSTGCRARCSTR